MACNNICVHAVLILAIFLVFFFNICYLLTRGKRSNVLLTEIDSFRRNKSRLRIICSLLNKINPKGILNISSKDNFEIFPKIGQLSFYQNSINSILFSKFYLVIVDKRLRHFKIPIV